MDWFICFIISAAAAAAGICIAVIAARGKKRGGISLSFRILFAFFFISVFVSFLPIYTRIFEGERYPFVKTVLSSIRNSFQVFTLDADASVIREAVSAGGALEDAYRIMMYILFVISPMLTFGFIASFFGILKEGVRFFLSFGRDMHIFSSPNERSAALAKDIKEKNKKASVVFAGTDDTSPFFEKIASAGSVIFKKDILSLPLFVRSGKRKTYIYIMDDDEIEGTKKALALKARYRDQSGFRIYLFASGKESSLAMEGASSGNIFIRRIDAQRSYVLEMLYDEGKELFSSALCEGEEKDIQILIAGLGRYGETLLRNLPWYCQMDGYRVKISAFDEKTGTKDRMAHLYPGLLSGGYDGKDEGDASYDINIEDGIGFDSKTFFDEAAEMGDISYVFVDTGDDAKNTEISVGLRRLFEKEGIKPQIRTFISSSGLSLALDASSNFRGQRYDIRFVSEPDEIYRESVVINSPLELMALEIHKKWGKEEDFFRYEYYYNSSMSAVIHKKAREECGIEEEKKPLLEHKRWCAYMRSEGYIYSGSVDPETRNDLAHLHNDLTGFFSLPESEKEKDRNI